MNTYVRKKLGRPKVERFQPVNLEGLDKYQRMKALNNFASKRCRDSRQTKEIFEENELPKLEKRNEKLKERVKLLENKVKSLSDLTKIGYFKDLKNRKCTNKVIESKDISTKYIKKEDNQTVDIKEEYIEISQCNNCEESFKKTEMHACRDKPNFHCQFCGEMFTNRIDLGNHILHGSSTCLSNLEELRFWNWDLNLKLMKYRFII